MRLKIGSLVDVVRQSSVVLVIFLGGEMDYKQATLLILKDLGDNYTPERFTAAVHALSMGLAKVMALIDDHQQMHNSLDVLLDAIAAQACAEHEITHNIKAPEHEPENNTMTYEEFLRDVFHPEKFNG